MTSKITYAVCTGPHECAFCDNDRTHTCASCGESICDNCTHAALPDLSINFCQLCADLNASIRLQQIKSGRPL